MKKICLFIGIMFSFQITLRSQVTDEFKKEQGLLHPPPVVNFYITGLCYGDTTRLVSKTDLGEIYWAITNDKGDTLYSFHGETTSYYFKKKGVYNICQTADNGHLATKIRTVLVDTIIQADFEYRPCFNEFNNQSYCSDQYVWLMPDHSVSTDTFPAFQFKQPGTYPVKLTAKKGNKAHTIVKMISIVPDSIGIPDATFTFKRHGSSNVFDFKAVDSLQRNYSWSFGDRTFDDTSGYKVTHTFDMDKYSPPMSLRVGNSCGFQFYELDPFKITGVEMYSLDQHTSVYPNPAKEELNISISDLPSSDELTLKLMDLKGAVLLENHQHTSGMIAVKWNTSSLARGIYVLQIIDRDQFINRKIVIQ